MLTWRSGIADLCNVEELNGEVGVLPAVPHHVGPVGVALDATGLHHSSQHYHNPAERILQSATAASISTTSQRILQ
jgi:hypothetical protein